MQNEVIFLPVLGHMFLTILLLSLLNNVKKQALQNNTVNLERRALFVDAWPENVIKVSNSVKNQFELPVLFYTLSFALWATDFVNIITLSLAIVFVFSRYIHAYIHTGENVVKNRLRAYKIGAFALVFLFIATLWNTIRTVFF